jgi:UDP-2-acetamido-3-amino-2,3-dideoxy-glucuronate N-acetyltransferase
VGRNIAVVGCGYWGKNLVRNFAQLAALHTICDLDPKRLEELKSLHSWVNVDTDYQQVLKNEEIKGVVIAAPATLHYSMAREALLAGKDVFVEKPFTLKSSEAQELVALSVQRKRVLMVGHLMLYHPAVQMLKRYVQSGELGDILYLYSTRVNLGQVRRDESALWRLVPHDVSMFLYLLDGFPETVSAQGAAYVQPELEDVVFITLKFPKGIIAHIHASWLDPHKIRQLTVVGSKKMAVFDDMEPKHKLKIYDKGVAADYEIIPASGALALRSGEVSLPQVDLTEPLLLECQHFIGCIEDRCQPLSDGKQGLQVIVILDAVQRLLEREGQQTIEKEGGVF